MRQKDDAVTVVVVDQTGVSGNKKLSSRCYLLLCGLCNRFTSLKPARAIECQLKSKNVGLALFVQRFSNSSNEILSKTKSDGLPS